MIGLDTYDKVGNGGDAGGMSDQQMAWFRHDLAAHRDRPTLVFGHHPLVMQDSAFPITSSNSLDQTQAADHPRPTTRRRPASSCTTPGHTHRNHRTVSPAAPDVVHQEIAAVKEYPGGFTLLRLHTGGYALNFYKSTQRDGTPWSERSRQEIQGYWPQFAFGNNVADRNTVVKRDLSGLHKPQSADSQ